MYGIRRTNEILCLRDTMKIFLPISLACNPVVIYSAIEADLFLQKIINLSNDYTLVVYKFTEDELEQLIINRLKGH